VLQQIEGSQAVAEAVARCRPRVVCAYPITPQTHIVEALGRMVRSGALAPCRFLNVESEFAAMSVAIGASATGARAYTATASQGLLFMAEAVYNAGGLGLPVVMTLANRAVGAPINIWNDHSDAMAVRDAGWVQLFASSNQEAVDQHVLAFRLAEELSVPAMVCMDGFVLTHATEAVSVPSSSEVDAFLPPYRPRQVLDPEDPISIGAMVGPEAFTEVRYLAHRRMLTALDRIPALAAELGHQLGRPVPALVAPYRVEGAEVVLAAMGSVLGTIADAVDTLRAAGRRVGALGVTTFRPFPATAVRQVLEGVPSVVVLDRALSTGFGGVLGTDVAMALAGAHSRVWSVVAGLGGRPITEASIQRLATAAVEGTLAPVTFLDLDRPAVEAELAHVAASPRSGPTAENLVRRRRRPSGAGAHSPVTSREVAP
jgi:pyruvate ferredoxin oxidoreductase alpha subunit